MSAGGAALERSEFDEHGAAPPEFGPKAVTNTVYKGNTKAHVRVYHVQECSFAEVVCVCGINSTSLS